MDPKAEAAVVEKPQVGAMESGAAGPQGLGGWLIVPAMGLAVVLVETVAGIVWMVALAGGSGLALVDLVFRAGVILWVLLAGFRFLKRKNRAPETMAAVMIIYVLGKGGMAGLNWMVGGGVSDLTVAWAALMGVFTAIWVPYLLVSKRVKNTFVNP